MRKEVNDRMKKDIYIIKNDINNKVYIGQATDSKIRFKAHCQIKQKDIYFDKIIHKYGAEHFWYEILESQIENYNEREKYWIEYYNSIVPNGYNLSPGGDQTAITNRGINTKNSAIKSEAILFAIIKDIQESDLTFIDIGEKYNVNKNIISKINCGRVYKLDIFNYPLRPFYQGKKVLSTQQEKEIKNLIKNSILSFNEIAQQYNVLPGIITKINMGERYYDKNESYPLRTSHIPKKHLMPETINWIYDKLQEGKLSLRAIAKELSISPCTVQGINNGTIKCYRNLNITYPIRAFSPKKPVSTISAKESTITIDT